jgi:hypothetical protein
MKKKDVEALQKAFDLYIRKKGSRLNAESVNERPHLEK